MNNHNALESTPRLEVVDSANDLYVESAYDAACKALQEARTTFEAKDIRDKAEAMRVYSKQANNRKMEIDEAEIIIRAERKIGQLMQQEKKQKRALKDKWIKQARKEFDPGSREPCFVCGKYKSITHAHHVLPLAIQYDNGFLEPCQDYFWLCPTHHSAVHSVIDDIRGYSEEKGVGLNVLADLEKEESQKVINIALMASGKKNELAND